MERGFYKSISLIHTAFFLGQVVLFAVMIFLKRDYSVGLAFQEDMFLLIVPCVLLGLYYLSTRIYQMRLNSIASTNSKEQKIDTFKSAYIIRLAMLEGGTLLAIMIYYIQGNFIYLILAAGMLIYFYRLKPNKGVIASDAQLTSVEAESL